MQHVPRAVTLLAETPDDGTGFLSPLLQYGTVGLVLAMVVIGILVPRYVMTNLMSEKDNWRTAFERERDAHQLTRENLAKAEERGDVAIEQGKTLTKVMEELGYHPDVNRSQ